MGTTYRDEGGTASVVEEIVDACHAQNNWTAKIMEELGRLSEERDGLIASFALEQLAALPPPSLQTTKEISLPTSPTEGAASTASSGNLPSPSQEAGSTSIPPLDRLAREGPVVEHFLSKIIKAKGVTAAAAKATSSSSISPSIGGEEGGKISTSGAESSTEDDVPSASSSVSSVASASTPRDQLAAIRIDSRVFRAMLLSIKSSPALYRALLSHPIIHRRGSSFSKSSSSKSSSKSSKKKKREKEKQKEGSRVAECGTAAEGDSGGRNNSSSVAGGIESSLLASHLQLPVVGQQFVPLSGPTLEAQSSLLIAKALADRSLQAILIAVKVLLSTYLTNVDGNVGFVTPTTAAARVGREGGEGGGLLAGQPAAAESNLPRLGVAGLLGLLFPYGSSNPFEKAIRKAEAATAKAKAKALAKSTKRAAQQQTTPASIASLSSKSASASGGGVAGDSSREERREMAIAAMEEEGEEEASMLEEALAFSIAMHTAASTSSSAGVADQTAASGGSANQSSQSAVGPGGERRMSDVMDEGGGDEEGDKESSLMDIDYPTTADTEGTDDDPMDQDEGGAPQEEVVEGRCGVVEEGEEEEEEVEETCGPAASSSCSFNWSAEGMRRSLSLFRQRPAKGQAVPVDTVILALLSFLDEQATAYKTTLHSLQTESSASGASSLGGENSSASSEIRNSNISSTITLPPPPESIQPHPLTFLLLHSLLMDLKALLAATEEDRSSSHDDGEPLGKDPSFFTSPPSSDNPALEEDYCEEDVSAASVSSPLSKKLRMRDASIEEELHHAAAEGEGEGPLHTSSMNLLRSRLRTFTVAASLSTLSILDANVLYVSKVGLGSSVGLGQVAAPTLSLVSSARSSRRSSTSTTSQNLGSGGEGGADGSGAAEASSRGEGKKGSTSSSSSLLGSSSSSSSPSSSPLFVSKLRSVVEHFMCLSEGSAGSAIGDLSEGTQRVRTEAMNTWATGLEFFYPKHAQRHCLLMNLLTAAPHKGSREKERAGGPLLREAQREKLLQRLCLRLAQPDLCQYFFTSPGGHLAAAGGAGKEETEGGTITTGANPLAVDSEATEGEEEAGDLMDDGRRTEAGPPSLLVLLQAQVEGSSGAAAGPSSSSQPLSSSSSKATIAAGAGQLPLVVDILMERLQDPAKSHEDNHLGVAKLALLAALQARLVGVLTAWSGREADLAQLELDPRRCSENIVLSNNGHTATQRGSKSWGSVLATAGFAPNTGVHLWSVRLDRCEKGHVFIGVCTSEASTRTYVGGDRYGWGMIGTKALWHNRSKVRGDYSDGYGSRCLVRIKLDTDRGTLSLGLGTSDWGIAFDKLPRIEVLYPAVGLYQREDQVTLLPVTATDLRAKRGGAPERAIAAKRAAWALGPVTEYAESLTRATHYILDALEEAGDKDGRSVCARHPFLQKLLPALVASLCQLPPLPAGGGLLALTLLPLLTSLLKRLDKILSRAALGGQAQERALFADVDGTWVIRSGAADSIPAQEYQIQLCSQAFSLLPRSNSGAMMEAPLLPPVQQGGSSSALPSPSSVKRAGTRLVCRTIRGHGEGNSSKVTVEGAVLGSRLRLLETWLQGGTCVVEGRLALDGSAFYGTFRDLRSATKGQISGRRVAVAESEADLAVARLARLEAILTLLSGKLACLLMIGVEEVRPMSALVEGRGDGEGVEGDQEGMGDDEVDVDEEKVEVEDEIDASEEGLDASDDHEASAAAVVSMDDSGGSGLGEGGSHSHQGGPAAAAAVSASTVGEADEALLKSLATWRCSRLLSSGLPLSATLDALRSKLRSFPGRSSGASSRESSSSSLTSSSTSFTETWWRAAVLHLPTEEDARGEEGETGIAEPFYGDLIERRGAAAEVDRWVQRHVGESPFTRVGGEAMKVARRVVLAALLRHSGALSRVLPELSRVGSGGIAAIQQTTEVFGVGDAAIQQQITTTRPAELLIRVWRSAQQIVEWAIRQKQTSGLTFPAMAGLLEHKARFLLSVLPSAEARAVAQELASLPPPPSMLDDTSGLSSQGAPSSSVPSPLPFNATTSAEDRCGELLAEAVTFMECGLRDMEALRKELLRASLLAFDRAAGLRAFIVLLGSALSLKKNLASSSTTMSNDDAASSSAHQTMMGQSQQQQQGGPPPGTDRPLSLGAAVAAALQFLPPALLGHADPFGLTDGLGSSAGAVFGASIGSSVSSPSSMAPPGTPTGHYMDGLEGAGSHLRRCVTTAFEMLYTILAQTLHRASSSGDLDTSLVVLQAWGLVIHPEDHRFLARVGIFRALQAVLDGVRPPSEKGGSNETLITKTTTGSSSSSSSFSAESGGTAQTTAERMSLAARSRVARAALKVVHLLAGQVATTSVLPVDVTSTGPLSMAHGFPSPPASNLALERRPSGPDTLGSSLFDMLHRELQCALRQAAEERYPTGPRIGEHFSSSTAAGGGGGIVLALSGGLLPPPPPLLGSGGPSESGMSGGGNNSSVIGAGASGGTGTASAVSAWQEVGEEEELSSEQYCHRLLGLLQSVATSPACQRPLTSSKWLKILIGGLQTGSAFTQRRIFRLLRQLLPSISPTDFAVRIPASEEMGGIFALLEEDEGKMDGGSGGEKAEGGGSSVVGLIDLLMEAVASSVPWEISRKERGEKGGQRTKLYGGGRDSGSLRFMTDGSLLWSAATALVRRLMVESGWATVIRDWLLKGLEDVPDVLCNPRTTTSEGEGGTDWSEVRPRLCRAVASLSVLGGLAEELRIGGMVSLRPLSLYGVPETLALRLAAMSQTSGILIAYDGCSSGSSGTSSTSNTAGASTSAAPSTDHRRATAEVVMVEREGIAEGIGALWNRSTTASCSASSLNAAGSSRGLSLAHGLPVRAMRLNAEDLVAVSEVEPPLTSVEKGVAAVLLGKLVNNAVKWLEESREVVFEAERKAEKDDDSAEEKEEVEDEEKEEDAVVEEDKEEKKDERVWDVRAAQGLLVLEAFKAASEVLAHAPLSSSFLRSPGAEEAFRTLLTVAVTQTSTGSGLRALGALQDAWLESMQKWREQLKPPAYTGGSEAFSGGASGQPPAPGGGGASDGQPGTSGSGRGGSGGGGSSAATMLSTFMQAFTGSEDQGGQGASSAASTSTTNNSAKTTAAVATMMEMGFPKEWCLAALRRCGNNVEVAVNYCFEHGSDMDQILAEEQALAAAAQATAARGGAGGRSAESVRRSLETTILMKQLLEMGFPPSWCSKALAANHNNVNAALTWILSNGEALAAAEEAGDGEGGPAEGGEEEGMEEEEEEVGADSAGRAMGPNPLRVVSGAAEIRPDLSVEGVASGGFASAGCRGCLVTEGKWCYEAVLRTAGCMQIGWCDASFRGDAAGGDGVGDGPHSWAYDGWREFKWHDGHSEWGAHWKPGDVVGCLVDLDEGTMSFTLNGEGEEVKMGLAFTGLRYAGGLYPCASFNRREKLQFNFGGSPFKFQPPDGYRPYIDAVRNAMALNILLKESLALDEKAAASTPIKGKSEREGMDVVEGEGDKGEKGREGEEEEEEEDASFIEDCMEEAIGIEHMRAQHRYFSPEASGGRGGGSRSSGTHRAWRTSGLWTAASDLGGGRGGKASSIIGKTLVKQVLELCVLYARRAILTLMATWPVGDGISNSGLLERGGPPPPIDLSRLLTNTDASVKTIPPLVQLLRLVSVVSPATTAHLSKVSVVPIDALGGLKSCLESALSAGGAPTLYAVTPAFAEAVREAPDAHLEPLASCVLHQLYLAMDRNALVGVMLPSAGPVPSSAPSSAAAQQQGGEGGTGGESSSERWTDEDAVKQPNLCLAVWATSLLLSRPTPSNSAINKLAAAWSLALRSPAVQLKTIAASVLSSMIQEAVHTIRSGAAAPAALASVRLANVLHHLGDTARIRALTLQRVWAERPSHPIYSRFAQALAELESSLGLASELSLPTSQQQQQKKKQHGPLADPAVPLQPPPPSLGEQDDTAKTPLRCLEWEKGLVASDRGWELWTGTLTQHAVPWRRPSRSSMTAGLDGGEGPPILLPGGRVIRGPDWKAEGEGVEDLDGAAVGTVEEILAWDGQLGVARRVVWPNGKDGVYRWGAEGRFDLTHVEVGKGGEVLKRYPYPDTMEAVAARKGFGELLHNGVALWIRPPVDDADDFGHPLSSPDGPPVAFEGICEWPDQGAATWVTGERYADGSLSFTEQYILTGTEMGWTSRFGETKWRKGIRYTFSPVNDVGEGDEGESLLGHYSFRVQLGGEMLEMIGDVRLQQKDLFALDRYCKANSVSISDDGRSASCASSEGKVMVYGSVGFARGVHYWEIKIEQEELGSIFLGVAEKLEVPGPSLLNRWQGWGFVNYRASFAWNPGEAREVGAGGAGGGSPLQTSSPERPYGENFQSGDIVGIKLDMERGVLSFFLDGMKYGEHILADLDVAHEGMLGNRPHVRPCVLFPVIGFRKKGDRITLTGRWFSTPGTHPSVRLDDVKAVGSLLHAWQLNKESPKQPKQSLATNSEDRPDWLPAWIYRAAWNDCRRWRSGRWRRILTRAQSLAWVDVDASIDACVQASLLLGLKKPLLAGDRIRMTRRCGRVLEQPEARVVLGAYRGLLWYQIDSQREGAAVDGASLAWFWLPCDADGLQLVGRARRGRLPVAADDVTLQTLPSFQGGRLRVVYDQAVVREGLEIDTSEKVGEVEHGAILLAEERRVNSSNVARFRIHHHGVEGWISERIRGEREDLIVIRIKEETSAVATGAAEGGQAAEESEAVTDGPLRLKARLRTAVQAWKKQVANLATDAMDTGPSSSSASSLLDPESLWCVEEEIGPSIASFKAFESLSGYMHHQSAGEAGGEGGNVPWTLEADEQLAQLITDAAAAQGEAPINMSYSHLWSSLQRDREEEKDSQVIAGGGGGLLLNHGRGPLSDKPALVGVSLERLMARACLLRVLNERLSRALPLLSLALPEVEWEREQIGYSDPITVETTYLPTRFSATGGSSDSSGSHVMSHQGIWKPLCMARRLRALRRLILTHTKRGHWEGVLQATTTPTQLQQDEYEDPREIKTIKINRVRASASRLASVRNMNERLRLSVFGQVHKEMRSWNSSAFRRAYLGKGHGGQRRAFKVRFLGEGVNDYGGPYRAVFEQIADELQDDRLPISQRPGESCLLPLLVPCPNRMGAVGSNQDKFVLSPGHPFPLALELMQLLGKLVGMALRHALPMGLDLPATVWRPLVGLSVDRSVLESLDLLAVRTLQQVESTGVAADAIAGTPRTSERSLVPEGWEDLAFTTHLSDGSLVALPGIENAAETRVTKINWREYVRLVELTRLKESSAMLGAFQDGLLTVLPQELFPLFTEEEFERLICGVREVDVDLLRQCTDYDDTSPDAPHVRAFWEVLHEMSPQERTDFLRFTWARSRMPSSAKDFPMNFRIQGPQGGAKEHPDDYLPHAQTCFFSLSLPPYSTKEILRAKLLLAITNSPNMDADVRLHNAEGWAETG